MWSMYCVEHILCGAYTMWSIYCVEHILCGACTMWSIYYVEHILCGAYTMWSIYYVEHILCGFHIFDTISQSLDHKHLGTVWYMGYHGYSMVFMGYHGYYMVYGATMDTMWYMDYHGYCIMFHYILWGWHIVRISFASMSIDGTYLYVHRWYISLCP